MRIVRSLSLLAVSALVHSNCARSDPSVSVAPPTIVPWRDLLREIYRRFQANQHDSVEPLLRRALDYARQYPHHSRYVATTYDYVASHEARNHRFPEAVAAYLECKRIALAAGDKEAAAVAANALSNVYLHSNSIQEAAESARQAVALLPSTAQVKLRIAIAGQAARMESLAGNLARAVPGFVSVLEDAEAAGLQSPQADAWQFLGRAYLRAGDLDSAERAAMNAFRLRWVHRDPDLPTLHRDLAELLLRRDRPQEAISLLDAAARHAPSNRLQRWELDRLRGSALLEAGRSAEALQVLRRALGMLHETRAYWIPGDQLLIGSAAQWTGLHDTFVDAAMLHPSSHLVTEAFSVAEASRAIGLRIRAESRARVPNASAYADLVARMQTAYERAIADPSATAPFRALRLELAEMEAGAGPLSPNQTAASPWAQNYSSALLPDEALISFSLGERRCWRWTVTREGVFATQLAAKDDIARRVAAFRSALESGSPSPDGGQLAAMLLANLPEHVRAKPSWMFIADDVLFQLPFAALRDPATGRYLIESHAIQQIPGAWMLLRRSGAQTVPTSFLGVGDAVYNSADPRRSKQIIDAMQLPRLPGSAAELEACARLNESGRVLSGVQATPTELAKTIAALQPSVIHFASHVIPAPNAPGDSLIALSPEPGAAAPSFIGPEWIAGQRLQAQLVVLNGCRSGSGEVNAAEGLMGLSRAWLYAGAGAVIGTHWPTVDDSGFLLQEFYRRIRTKSIAAALQTAQVEMLRSGGWRAHPRYWAAYFLVGHPVQPRDDRLTAGLMRR